MAVNIKTPIDAISASQFHGGFCLHSITPSLLECVRPLGNQTSLGFMESLLTRYRSEPHGRNKAPNEPRIEIRKASPPRADTAAVEQTALTSSRLLEGTAHI